VLISVVFALHWLDVAPRVDASKVPADAIADVENVRALRAGIDLARLVREIEADPRFQADAATRMGIPYI